ncbi:hypothetical protein J2Q11_10435 [Tenacibaculum finnmarkense genomovar finnmarkense]|uniref:hypothetical protein n=1 Tax=Tenacibaculum finnmarkense TaxID=2781243 RepID=UPI000C7D8F2B|nr:hypothetical protein [Tenacibaculum finnmarkense]MBE7646529.1 hypothetical protein [Tenacibaculum finnmarkense genomovar ulcerans]MBE7660599.1 hypothetical protein [Tenacibaculum finnmarkense genomovar finnmarkense]MCD8413300.1 hypothetical protein [Tenacibaculum finnmarkense genomovar ulcerans]MCD8418130.1 hypothetical protein [Tenacibaculum finnmarkense genomovar finnmarkense]MCG8186469.1 hypothetical protein [Tenacibaculum finnmarkense genomovar finnmarkense]
MKLSNQERHEKIIDFLNQFSQYQYNGQPALTKKKKPASPQFINNNDIDKAVVAFTDVLNLNAGSVGDFDLYTLMNAYLTKPELRSKINEIVNQLPIDNG